MAVDDGVLASRVAAAVRRSTHTQKELAVAIGMDPTALSKALNGKRRFSSLELGLVADYLGVAVSELLRGADMPDRGPLAAKVAARVQPDAAPAVTAAVERLRDLLEVDATLTDAGYGAPPARLPLPVPRGDAVQAGEALAGDVRDLAGVRLGAPEDLAGWAETALQVDVAVEPLPAGMDGLCVTHADYRLVLVSSAVPATRQRWTLAHEIGHLAAGDGEGMDLVVDQDLFGRRDATETRANVFAAALLMPGDALRRKVGHRGQLDEPTVAEMLSEYRVSLDALAYRLHNLQLTNAAGRDRLRRLSTRELLLQSGSTAEYQRQQEARGARRLPAGLLSRALRAYAAGAVSVRVLSRLTGQSAGEILEAFASPEELVGGGLDDVVLV